VDFTSLKEMYNYDDPWDYIAGKLNSREIELFEETSIIIRLLDSQREGHFSRPFDYERFNQFYMPKDLG
jgi:hypothetical protein